MARPKLYANAAERAAAHRARNAILEIRLATSTAATLDSLAKELDVPRTEVVNSLINFALLNRNWAQLGLFGKRLVRHEAAAPCLGKASDAAAD